MSSDYLVARKRCRYSFKPFRCSTTAAVVAIFRIQYKCRCKLASIELPTRIIAFNDQFRFRERLWGNIIC